MENGERAESIVAINERAKNSWIKQAKAMGMSADEAREMADSLFAIPESVKSQVVVSGAKVSVGQAKDLNKALKVSRRSSAPGLSPSPTRRVRRMRRPRSPRSRTRALSPRRPVKVSRASRTSTGPSRS